MKTINALRNIALTTSCGALALSSVTSMAQEAAVSAPVQTTQAPVPIVAQRSTPASTFLPANTEVLLRMNQEVTTKGRTWDEGDTFNMTVVHDIMLGEYVVIPAGTRGVGRIKWLTSKGAFGKSGKMDIEIEYLELNGQRVALDGEYRQEGEGNTLATVGGVIAAGIFAGFVTGRSGRIPQGRELMATTESNLPVTLPEGATIAPQAIQATVAVPVTPTVEAVAPKTAEATVEVEADTSLETGQALPEE